MIAPDRLFPLVLLLLGGCTSVPTLTGFRESWPDPAPVEASGLVYLPGDGLFLAHDDDSATRLYAWKPGAGEAFVIDLPEVRNRDWEDIALILRPGEDPLVVLGEIGDNAGRYPVVALHVFRLFGLDGDRPFPEAERVHTLLFTYPGGPRDAESLVYDPLEKELLVISKREDPPAIFALPVSADSETPSNGEALEAKRLGPLDTIPSPTPEFLLAHPRTGRWSAQPTGADISPDGRALAVITYNDLHIFEREPDESWVEAVARPPRTLDVPVLEQTEAVCYGDRSTSLYITTEGANPEVIEILLDSP